jgi:hypothetical protein
MLGYVLLRNKLALTYYASKIPEHRHQQQYFSVSVDRSSPLPAVMQSVKVRFAPNGYEVWVYWLGILVAAAMQVNSTRTRPLYLRHGNGKSSRAHPY